MHRDSIRRDSRQFLANRQVLLAAPVFALALAACAGGGEVASTDVAAPTPAVAEAASTSSDSSAAPDSTDTEAEESTSETSSDAPAASGGPDVVERVSITRLSAEEAIANAETNQPILMSADNVLDIETLAVADGSVQTLRGVVDGDRPVLLWFFSPH